MTRLHSVSVVIRIETNKDDCAFTLKLGEDETVTEFAARVEERIRTDVEEMTE